MSIQLTVPPKRELKPRIVVFGVGGAGCNAVNNMIAAGLEGVDFVVANTDAQSLSNSSADRRIQIGSKLTEGLGAGADPAIGKAAAEETMAEIVDMLQGSHMAFVTAGMGGGTGTGAAPVIARAAREQGILTVGVITKPFDFEGGRRMRAAIAGIEELAAEVDTLIIIPNQNLFRIANAQTTFAEAFAMADEVLHSGVAGITDLMVKPGLINLDFADVKTVMNEMGKAMMGTGEAEGDKRATEAAEAAIANPLLEDVSMQGAQGVLINITGGDDMTLYEVDEAANRIREEVDPECNIIIGSTFDDALSGSMRVSVVATGIEAGAQLKALDGGQVINMAADAPVEMPEDMPAEAMPAGVGAEMVSAPLADDAPMAPMTPQGDSAAMPPAPSADAGALPGFLTGQQAEKPARPALSKRKRSFIDRVFGNKKPTPPEQSLAPSQAEPKADMVETVMAEPAMTAPLEMAEIPVPQQPMPQQPAASIDELDGIQDAPMETVAQAEAQPVTAEVESAPSMEIPQETAEATPQETSEEQTMDAAAPAIDADTEAKADSEAAPKAAAPAEAPKAAKPAKAEAPAVSAPSVDAVSVQPVVQTTMDTGPTMSSGSFEGDQLDIPAFLRR
ncbi:MAG: cell division protein FtsZ [Alphaproteobacteria bacterium]|jgi:cell division protein FtsZ|nr:cell division protein FtsZ [Alphaproteobacteria bacterium]